jgi:hypothetical protein
MLDAMKQLFQNETANELAWESAKAVGSVASEYVPSAKTLLTLAAVAVGGAVVIGGGREANKRGYLHAPTRANPNPFGKRPTATLKDLAKGDSSEKPSEVVEENDGKKSSLRNSQ